MHQTVTGLEGQNPEFGIVDQNRFKQRGPDLSRIIYSFRFGCGHIPSKNSQR